MNHIPASMIKKAIIYLSILSYTPPQRVADLLSLQERFGDDWPQIVNAAARLMVSFQQATRDPDEELVAELTRAALGVDSSPESCRAFQEQMIKLAQLPGRAKENNRIHRKRGCRLCQAPCRYGYFSLISEPDFDALQQILEVENNRPAAERKPVLAVWYFTLNHLSQTLEAGKWHIGADQLGNLAYCLVSLATAKSRYRFPEEQMRKFQEMNQRFIQQNKGDSD